MDAEDPKLVGLSKNDKIVQQAKDRYERGKTWESYSRMLYLEDTMFANGDSNNNYQWPGHLITDRTYSEKPTLTVNKTRQHNLQIINDAKQNKPGVKVRPTGGEATYKAAQIFDGVIRYIEYKSRAEQAYDTATTHQVTGGIGYWRLVTEYIDTETFDQDLRVRRIKDPMSVYLDPDINEIDGSDARWGIIFDDMPLDDFRMNYPEHMDIASAAALGNTADGWMSKDHIRVAEYYTKSMKTDLLVTWVNIEGKQKYIRKSRLGHELYLALKRDKQQNQFRERQIEDPEVKWYKIAGDTIIDENTWVGVYVPIIRVIGEETVINGVMDRKGHTRALKDPQRMYNYWTSSATENVALQTKSPYIGPMQAFEGLENYWNDANKRNFPWLPFNQYDDAGNKLDAPQRQQAPQMGQAYMQGMQIAQQEMMMAGGQYQSQFGQAENATSGRAIAERQRQGDNATYHYIDGLAIGIRFTGVQLIDAIPKIYDTERIIQIMAEDGKQQAITVNPKAQAAYSEKPNEEEHDGVDVIFNPSVGTYDVQADVGPAYSTRRQEAWNAFTQITAQNKELVAVIGDLMFLNADFPGSDKIAERLKNMVPAQALGEGPPPQVQKAMAEAAQQMEQLQKMLADVLGKQAKMQTQLDDKRGNLELERTKEENHNETANYEAETHRLTAAANAIPEAEAGNDERLNALIRGIVEEMLTEKPGLVDPADLPPDVQAIDQQMAAMPAQGMEGAPPDMGNQGVQL